MKIAIWNVMNGMGSSQQIELFKSLCVDLAILPELKYKNIDGLNPKDAVWITNNFSNKTPKGLGVLSFNDTSLRELPRDEDMEIYIPITVKHPNYAFDLLAVWNFYFACKRGRFKGVKGDGCLEWSAIRKYTKELNSNCLLAEIGVLDQRFRRPNLFVCVKCTKMLGLRAFIIKPTICSGLKVVI